MEEVERTNTVIVCPNQWVVFILCNLYYMKVDYRNMNCYNCMRFGHIVRYCKDRETEGRIGEGRRLEYRRNENNRERRIDKDKII